MSAVHQDIAAPFQPSRPEGIPETTCNSFLRNAESLLLQFVQDTEYHQRVQCLVFSRQADLQSVILPAVSPEVSDGIPGIDLPDPYLSFFRNDQGSFGLPRFLFQHIPDFGLFRRIADNRNTGFDDPGFFTGDFLQRIAQVLHMIHSDSGNGTDRRFRNSIGRIKSSAHPGLRNNNLGSLSPESMESQSRSQFERSTVIIPLLLQLLRRVQRSVSILLQLRVGDRNPFDPDSFPVGLQEGRRIQSHLVSGSCQHAAQHGTYASLAVGSGHMDHRAYRPCL